MTIDFTLPLNQFQEQITKQFKNFSYPTIQLKNDCHKTKKFELSNTQKFISNYFTPQNPNGILLYHSIGSGKTLTGVNLIKHFESKNFNAIWVTRRTLLKDLTKATNIIPLKPFTVFSYKQFSNVCKRKGENYKKLLKKAQKINPNTNDPFYKTIVIIDEAHKLYTNDLKIQEMHKIDVIEKMVFESYTKSGLNRARIVLMSATPITNDPMEVIKLFNLIITNKDHRFDINHFKQEFLSVDGKIHEYKKKTFVEQIKGLVSYINTTNDPSKFAQVKYTNVLVPVSVSPNLSTDLNYCNVEYSECKKLGFSVKECRETKKVCRDRINDNKKVMKNIEPQESLLVSKCGILYSTTNDESTYRKIIKGVALTGTTLTAAYYLNKHLKEQKLKQQLTTDVPRQQSLQQNVDIFKLVPPPVLNKPNISNGIGSEGSNQIALKKIKQTLDKLKISLDDEAKDTICKSYDKIINEPKKRCAMTNAYPKDQEICIDRFLKKTSKQVNLEEYKKYLKMYGC